MIEPNTEFEERLRRIKPRTLSPAMRNAVEGRLTGASTKRDWPMRCAIGSGLAAACVIVAMLIEQSPPAPAQSIEQASTVARAPLDPPSIYAFNFANKSLLDESWRIR